MRSLPMSVRLAIVAPILMGSSLSFAEGSVHEWLDRMKQAVEERNYQGTLVYMRPGMAETFTVYHRVEDGIATERVVSMGGDGAEIIRTQNEVICIFPGQQKVVVDQRHDLTVGQNPLRASLPEYSPELQENYELEMLAGGRVTGLAAVTIAINPRDQFRYGYRIWLEEQSAMPLKIQLIGDDVSMPIEELFFTAIDMPGLLPAELIESSIDTNDFSWVRHGKKSHHKYSPAPDIEWEAIKLPAGFMQTAASVEFMAEVSEPRTHLVYSDGLASVSVFIDAAATASEQNEGMTSMGASNAYTLVADDLLVTAVGEVPGRTVRQIATSMQMQRDAD
jgi:sigma-E factor negative regulatory protein RseB